MKIGFDIGGVLSKDKRWRDFARELECKTDIEVFIITDMHNGKWTFIKTGQNYSVKPYEEENG